MARISRKKLEQELRDSIAELTPAWKDASWDCAREPHDKERINMKKQNAKPLWQKSLIGIAAALVLFLTGIFAGQRIVSAKESVVCLDVNPSIELHLDQKDQVKKVVTRNEDAAFLLAQQDLMGLPAGQALSLILEDLIKEGYLRAEDPNAILLSVENRNAGKADALRLSLLGGISDTLQSHQLSASVLSQSVQQAGQKDADALAKQYGVSYGKIVFLQKLCELSPDLSLDAMAPLSLREIAAIVAEKNLDISQIAEYDPGDSLQENISDAIEDLDEAGNQAELIGWERAIAIAQQAVGGGTVTDRDLDLNRGKREYEIELTLGGVEYEVTIDAMTGQVLKKVREDQDKAPSSAAVSSFIGMDRAVSIALGKVNGKVIEKELDRDDQEYEISIALDGYCYEVKIDAISGAIQKTYKERLDAEDLAEINGVKDDDDDDDLDDDRDDDDDRPSPSANQPSGGNASKGPQPGADQSDDDDRDDDDRDDDDHDRDEDDQDDDDNDQDDDDDND